MPLTPTLSPQTGRGSRKAPRPARAGRGRDPARGVGRVRGWRTGACFPQWKEIAMNRLDGKVALISEAARGIGAETARLMTEAGAKIAIGDVLDERGRDTARALEGAGGEAMYIRLDVTREEDWTTAVSAVTGRFGALDILVNNAGLFIGIGLEEATLADWHRLCAVNLTGVFLGTKLALPALRDSAARSPLGSAIVNLSSVAGIVGSPS